MKPLTAMKPATVVRWIARIGSVAGFLFVGLFVIGNGGFPITVQTLLFPVGVVAGLAVAWKYEATGAVIALGSLAGFYALEVATAGRLPRGPYLALVASPALLFLGAWLMELGAARRRSLRPAA